MNSPNTLLISRPFGGFEGDGIRDGQRDFCSGRGAAPNSESGANSFRPFAHTREPPMSLASRMQHLRVDPATVVADDYPEALGAYSSSTSMQQAREWRNAFTNSSRPM
jgi:hypothetical protein